MSRIKEIREHAGLSQQEAADAMGMHLTNYNRLENGKTRLTTDKMDRLAGIFGCSPADFMTAPSSVRPVTVRQHVQAGHWSESLIWDEDDWYDVAVPNDLAYQALTLYGAETAGPSMNRRYPERSALIYTDMYETHESPVVGRRYIVESERPDGLREATVKTLYCDEQGEFWLLPDSDDPRFQQPIRLNNGDGNVVRIVGRVVYSVLREE